LSVTRRVSSFKSMASILTHRIMVPVTIHTSFLIKELKRTLPLHIVEFESETVTTLLVCRGLPGSGKSTWANKYVLDHEAGSVIRVNRDALREMLHAGRWKGQKTEVMTAGVRNNIIRQGLDSGKNVICDDTNLSPKVMSELEQLARESGAKVEIVDIFLDVPLETCIERDLHRLASVGEKVIRRMHNQYLRETYVPPVDKPQAILVDMDGTLALLNGRDPYADHLCGTDLPNKPVLDIVLRALMISPVNVIVMSGRDEGRAREATEKWLYEWGVTFKELLMRPAGDKRKDAIVKKELFDDHVRDNYNVLYVLDDRQQVVTMWRTMGLTVLQVSEGDF